MSARRSIRQSHLGAHAGCVLDRDPDATVLAYLPPEWVPAGTPRDLALWLLLLGTPMCALMGLSAAAAFVLGPRVDALLPAIARLRCGLEGH